MHPRVRLAPALLLAVLQSPEPAFDPAAAIQRGCALLVEAQEGEGRCEWPYEGVYRVEEKGASEPVIPLGYRVGGTAIACLALSAAPGWKDEANAPRRAALERGVGFVLEALDDPRLEAKKVAAYDVRGWAFIYALALFVTLEEHGAMPAAHAA